MIPSKWLLFTPRGAEFRPEKNPRDNSLLFAHKMTRNIFRVALLINIQNHLSDSLKLNWTQIWSFLVWLKRTNIRKRRAERATRENSVRLCWREAARCAHDMKMWTSRKASQCEEKQTKLTKELGVKDESIWTQKSPQDVSNQWDFMSWACESLPESATIGSKRKCAKTCMTSFLSTEYIINLFLSRRW